MTNAQIHSMTEAEFAAAGKDVPFIIRKEVEKASSFDAWKRKDAARIAKNAKAREAWIAETASKIA